MTKIMPLLVLLFSGAAQLTAQETAAQDDVERRLQSRMDELRAQMNEKMNEIQGEIDALHGVNNLANAVKDMKAVPKSVQTGAIEKIGRAHV